MGTLVIILGLLKQTSEVAPPLTGTPLDGNVEAIYQALWHVLAVGVSATAITKGVDVLVYCYQTASEALGGKPAAVSGAVKALMSLVLGLAIPPMAYAILLVDSGLVRFDFRGLVAVGGASFMSAWAWYQRGKYGKNEGGGILADG
jgi:hypothetical protein